MTTLKMTFRQGLHVAFQFKRIWFFWWGSNLLFAALILAPIAVMLDSFFSHRTLPNVVTANWDLQWMINVFFHYRPAYSSLTVQTIALIAGYALLQLFFTGGTIAIYRDLGYPHLTSPDGTPASSEQIKRTHRYRIGDLLKACTESFSRLLRLGLWSLLAYGVFLYGFDSLSGKLDLLVADSLRESRVATITWLKAIIFFVGMFGIKLFFDCAKILILSQNIRSTFRANWRTFRWFFQQGHRLIAIAGLYLALAAVTSWIGFTIFKQLPQKSLEWMLLFFLCQQFLLAWRIFLTLSQIASLQSLAPPPPGSAKAAPIDSIAPIDPIDSSEDDDLVHIHAQIPLDSDEMAHGNDSDSAIEEEPSEGSFGPKEGES